MTQKYIMHSPLYRLEQEFNREGLKLSRQTMANWLLNASDTWLRPIYDVLHMELCRETVLHGDETTLQVLKESGKAATSKSYMWLYRTLGGAGSVDNGCVHNGATLHPMPGLHHNSVDCIEKQLVQTICLQQMAEFAQRCFIRNSFRHEVNAREFSHGIRKVNSFFENNLKNF